MAAACKFCCLALLALCTVVIFTTADDKNDDHDKDLYNRPHSHLDHHRKPAKPKPRHHHKHNPKPITRHYHKHTPKPVKIVPTINKAALEVGTKFLQRYGYLGLDFNGGEEEITPKLKALQKYAGINETGEFDAATIELLQTPRCGMKDSISKLQKRQRRYLLQGGKWDLKGDRTLTWRLENTARNLGRDPIRGELKKAFALWQKNANIKFKETTDTNADIPVKFATGNHGDPYPFDNRGGTLAHAFYPYPGLSIAGDVHFDDDEDFKIGSPEGTDLLWVATHEIGHSLGLEHSNVRGAIMYPWYQGYKKDFNLQPDDASGIKALYGAAKLAPAPTVKPTTRPTTRPTTQPPTQPPTKPPTKPPTQPLTQPPTQPPTQPATQPPTKPPTKPPTQPPTQPPTEPPTQPPTQPPTKPPTKQPKIVTERPTPKPTTKAAVDPYNKNLRYKCPKFIDTCFVSQRFKWMLVFADRRMFLANRNGIRHGPLIAKDYFPHVQGMVDSAIENTVSGETLIFSGPSFYIYRGFMKKAGPIPLVFLGIDKSVKKIDAALKWQRNGERYIFSGTQYWKFNPFKPSVMDGYPKLIRDHWKGIPDYLNTAVTDFDQVTRFTKGEQYYTLNDRAVRGDLERPKYIGKGWMQCRATQSAPKGKAPEYNGPSAAEP